MTYPMALSEPGPLVLHLQSLSVALIDDVDHIRSHPLVSYVPQYRFRNVRGRSGCSTNIIGLYLEVLIGTLRMQILVESLNGSISIKKKSSYNEVPIFGCRFRCSHWPAPALSNNCNTPKPCLGAPSRVVLPSISACAARAFALASRRM